MALLETALLRAKHLNLNEFDIFCLAFNRPSHKAVSRRAVNRCPHFSQMVYPLVIAHIEVDDSLQIQSIRRATRHSPKSGC